MGTHATDTTAQEVLAIVSSLPLFCGLATPELRRIAEAAQVVVAARGERIFARGDPCTGFYTVLAGQIKLAMTSERGDEKVIEMIGPGQSFGEAVMFLDKPCVVAAEALTPARLLLVAKDSILRELACDPQLIRRFLGSLSLRLRRLVEDIENLSLNSGRERIIGFLLNNAGGTGGNRSVRLPFKKALLASRLNVTQEHFSRILNQLSEEGLIAVEGATVQILDTGRLAARGRGGAAVPLGGAPAAR